MDSDSDRKDSHYMLVLLSLNFQVKQKTIGSFISWCTMQRLLIILKTLYYCVFITRTTLSALLIYNISNTLCITSLKYILTCLLSKRFSTKWYLMSWRLLACAKIRILLWWCSDYLWFDFILVNLLGLPWDLLKCYNTYKYEGTNTPHLYSMDMPRDVIHNTFLAILLLPKCLTS